MNPLAALRQLSRLERSAYAAAFAGIWIAVAVSVAAAAWLGLAIAETKRAQADQDALLQSFTQVGVERVELTPEQYKPLAAKLQAEFPGLAVSADGAGLHISTPRLEDYETWRAALKTLGSPGQGFQFEIKQLCAGECPSAPFSMHLRGVQVRSRS
jgi:hypothetical protein